ncbi:MAG: phosphomannomutase [Moraxellaceae bacterium]|nr:MAG: phosphomannomutase [Moraxellaceae bacterium]
MGLFSKKDQQPAASSPAEKSQKFALFTRFVPAVFGSVLSILVCAGALYYLLAIQSSQQNNAIVGNNIANTYSEYVSQQLFVLNASLKNISQQSQLIQAIEAKDTKALANIARKSSKTLPFVTNIHIYLKGKARKDANSNPPVSFAQLDMIRRAERRSPPAPEIHTQNKVRYLNYAVSIQKDNKVIGSMLVNFRLQDMLTALPKLTADAGYIEIAQQFDKGEPLIVHKSGDVKFKNRNGISVQSGNGHWIAIYYPSDKINSTDTITPTIAAIVAVCTTITLGLSLLSLLLVAKSLEHNATRLTSSFNAMIAHEKHTSVFSLSIFTSLHQTIERLFQDYDAQVRHSALVNTDNLAQKNQQEFGSIDQPDDMPDIDISEDDTLLMGGAEADDDPLAMINEDHDMLNLDDIDLDEVDFAEPSALSSTDSTGEGGEATNEEISDEIFRAYDIRGIIGKNLNNNVANIIGIAIGSEAQSQGQSSIIVARDGRLSSPDLAQALIQGLITSGMKVIDIGLVPTPVLYFATHTLGTQSGVMVTGSHNPPEYNGFKIVIGSQALSNEKIQAIKQRIDSGQLAQGEGSYEQADISADYLERISNDVVLAKPLKIVIDCGNGATGDLAPSLFDTLGCTVLTLNREIDGNFPNHHPDPSNPENLQQLIEAVKKEGAELGIAFDGDGDRLGVVTPDGKIIWPDKLLMLYAKDLLSRNPGADVLYDVKCTRDIAELVSNMGGRAIMCETGHSIVKAKMRETGAVVGGEFSGHIFFNDRWYGFDDALYSTARLLEILSMEPFDATEVFAEFPVKVSTPELKIAVSETEKFEIIQRLQAEGDFPSGNIVTLDGVRVDYSDSWGLLRASNTTPCLVARFEGDNDAALANVQALFKEQLLKVQPNLTLPF